VSVSSDLIKLLGTLKSLRVGAGTGLKKHDEDRAVEPITQEKGTAETG